MVAQFDTYLRTLLLEALPALFGGDEPPVQLRLSSDRLALDPRSLDTAASQIRAADRSDRLDFDAANPAGPYTLTQPPYPGPRQVWLLARTGLTAANGPDLRRVTLRPDEVNWDSTDARVLQLALRPQRDLVVIAGVAVRYSVPTVSSTLQATQTLRLELHAADTALLAEAEALTIAVLLLNRQALVDRARQTYVQGDYQVRVTASTLTFDTGTMPAADTRALTLQASLELHITRTLPDETAQPITSIHSPRRAPDPQRPVAPDIELDA